MKKIILILSAVILSAGIMSAQNLGDATAKANEANEAYTAGDNETAIATFKEALAMAQACTEEGAADLVESCKQGVCGACMKKANELYKAKKYDEAITAYTEAQDLATEYGNDEIAATAATNLEKATKQKLSVEANMALKMKDFPKAQELYAKYLELDPGNAKYEFYLGQAFSGDGKYAEAEEHMLAAKAANEETFGERVNSQLSKNYLKQAQASKNAKDYAAAVEAALKSNEYSESANAYNIAAESALLGNKNEEAIEYYNKFLELAPDKAGVKVYLNIAQAYEKKGDKAGAKEYYGKVVNDPKFGAVAKQKIEALSK